MRALNPQAHEKNKNYKGNELLPCHKSQENLKLFFFGSTD